MHCLHVHNMTFLFLYLANCVVNVLGNNTLNMSVGIRLPLLPISTLYSNVAFLAPACF